MMVGVVGFGYFFVIDLGLVFGVVGVMVGGGSSGLILYMNYI